MKIKLLSIILIVAFATSGCLKNSNQPVTHINDVNISLQGAWTQDSGTANYYDAAGNKVYSAKVPFINLSFDGKSTLTETAVTTGAPTIATTSPYAISTVANADYVTITGDTDPHQYKITSLQSRALTFTETINYPEGLTILVGDVNITYYSLIQTNTYYKRDLPRN